MSRRFGRNQKRRFREDLAKAREAYDMQTGLLRHVSNKRQELADQIDRAKRLLQAGSVLLEPESLGFNALAKPPGAASCDRSA